ncbi:hypothetical protein LCGC14_1493840 [marine sediment metagenome]|uniref:Uncharacterized protein n=1 Tax=marine sediment metagenome TaxID=412755 RepID=A0A0F9LLI2_9ZZZZ
MTVIKPPWPDCPICPGTKLVREPKRWLCLRCGYWRKRDDGSEA